MAGSCIEGHRKRAKYLLGEAELGWPLASHTTRAYLTLQTELLKKQKTGTANSSSPPAQVQAPTPKAPSGMRNSSLRPHSSAHEFIIDGFTPKDPLFNTSLNVPTFSFGSEGANLEYSILSAILGNTSPEGNPPSDPQSSTTASPSLHSFSPPSSEYPTSWSGGPGNSLMASEPNGFFPSPFVTVRSAQTMFEDDRLILPTTDRPQTGSGSCSSTDALSQSFTSIDPGSSATASSTHTPRDPFTTSAPQASSVMSPSSALHPLAPRWPLSSADSAYVS